MHAHAHAILKHARTQLARAARRQFITILGKLSLDFDAPVLVRRIACASPRLPLLQVPAAAASVEETF
jgi:hypothetical protein